MSRFTQTAKTRYRRALLLEGTLKGLFWGGFASAAVLLALRVGTGRLPDFAANVPPAAAFVLIPLCALVGALAALRRMPSEAVLAALTDDSSHAGGFVLVADLPGADAWPKPEVIAPEVRISWLRPLLRLVFPALALVAALAVPTRWFESAAPVESAFPDVTAPLRNELAEIREEELLPPDDIESVEEELRRIEAAADPLKPAETLDAVDRLAARLNALLDLNEATVKRLTADREQLAALANAEDLAEQFKKMLESAPSSEDTMKDYQVCDCCGGKGCKQCCGCGEGEGEGEGEGDGDGDGDKPGSGAATRGRGDAPMDWTKQSEMQGAGFKDRARETNNARGNGIAKTGESISEDDPTEHAVRTGGGGLTEVSGRSTGVSVTRPVLPRHRATVRRFFEPERKKQ